MELAGLYQDINKWVERISEEEFERIRPYFKLLTTNKKQSLITAGDLNNKMFFVESGLVYSYKTLDSGQIRVITFARETDWISDLESFLSGTSAQLSVETLEASSLWSITKEDCDLARAKSPKFSDYIHRLYELCAKNLFEMKQIIFNLFQVELSGQAIVLHRNMCDAPHVVAERTHALATHDYLLL